jgi:tRNA U55 pseudouridine synthase TruB
MTSDGQTSGPIGISSKKGGAPSDRFTIAHFTTTVSSGTYIRSLAPAIGKDLGVPALAYHIHRTTIGHYIPLPIIGGFWRKKF